MATRPSAARTAALGGVLAALAVIIMSMGTLIPVATYVCPVMCILILEVVRKLCGNRSSWAWFWAVAILCLLFAPDKEAAVVFFFLGPYPMFKPWFDRRKGMGLWKMLYFNLVIFAAYWVILVLMGLQDVVQEFSGMGMVMTAVLLLLGNVTFLLLDRLLVMKPRKKARERGNHGK